MKHTSLTFESTVFKPYIKCLVQTPDHSTILAIDFVTSFLSNLHSGLRQQNSSRKQVSLILLEVLSIAAECLYSNFKSTGGKIDSRLASILTKFHECHGQTIEYFNDTAQRQIFSQPPINLNSYKTRPFLLKPIKLISITYL